jgi:mercuric ion transport protein
MVSPKLCQRVGIGGGILAALCCFTPLLVVTLGAVGLSAWLGWADLVLMPALGIFVLIAVYGFYAQQKATDPADDGNTQDIKS